jgi:SAM-dependent methyltransferase
MNFFVKFLRYLLYDNKLNKIDPNDKKLLEIHAKNLYKKKILKSAFNTFYDVLIDCRTRFVSVTGLEIELGSGVGFLKSRRPNVITSDIRNIPNIDLYLDAHRMRAIKRNSVSCIYAINVFHHLEDPDLFFKEVIRILKHGGACVLIEPHCGFISSFVHKYLHKSEIFDSKQIGWKAPTISGPLSGANQALSFIVFKRDISIFEKKYGKSLELIYQSYIPNSLRYFFSGGLNFHQILPDFLLPVIKKIEKFLMPIAKHWTLHEVTVLLKKFPTSEK